MSQNKQIVLVKDIIDAEKTNEIYSPGQVECFVYSESWRVWEHEEHKEAPFFQDWEKTAHEKIEKLNKNKIPFEFDGGNQVDFWEKLDSLFGENYLVGFDSSYGEIKPKGVCFDYDTKEFHDLSDFAQAYKVSYFDGQNWQEYDALKIENVEVVEEIPAKDISFFEWKKWKHAWFFENNPKATLLEYSKFLENELEQEKFDSFSIFVLKDRRLVAVSYYKGLRPSYWEILEDRADLDLFFEFHLFSPKNMKKAYSLMEEYCKKEGK